jgi:hypothetical protein
VDQQQPEQTVETASAESRAEWIRPQVDRFIAGGAEAGGSTSTDGIDILS